MKPIWPTDITSLKLLPSWDWKVLPVAVSGSASSNVSEWGDRRRFIHLFQGNMKPRIIGISSPLLPSSVVRFPPQLPLSPSPSSRKCPLQHSIFLLSFLSGNSVRDRSKNLWCLDVARGDHGRKPTPQKSIFFRSSSILLGNKYEIEEETIL